MSQATVNETRTKGPLNGVDTPTLFATINAVDGQRELAQFRFRATNRWQSGTHSRTSSKSFHGAGGEQEHAEAGEAANRPGEHRAGALYRSFALHHAAPPRPCEAPGGRPGGIT